MKKEELFHIIKFKNNISEKPIKNINIGEKDNNKYDQD